MKRKQRCQHKRVGEAVFGVTPESVKVMQDAIKVLKAFTQQYKASWQSMGQASRMVFAQETIQGVERKLGQMQGSATEVPLDQNENLVLDAALHIYMLGLQALPASAEQRRIVRVCRELRAFTSTL